MSPSHLRRSTEAAGSLSAGTTRVSHEAGARTAPIAAHKLFLHSQLASTSQFPLKRSARPVVHLADGLAHVALAVLEM